MKKTVCCANFCIFFLDFTGAKTALEELRAFCEMKVPLGKSLGRSCSTLEKMGHF